jgi:hypothetical protein
MGYKILIMLSQQWINEYPAGGLTYLLTDITPLTATPNNFTTFCRMRTMYSWTMGSSMSQTSGKRTPSFGWLAGAIFNGV